MKIDARYHEVFNILSLAEKVQSMTVYPPVESELFRASRKITAVSRSVAKELREYDLDPSEITIVGNGVDEKTFVPARNRDYINQYVLYTGVLRARKGLFDFIDCAKYVCKEHPDARFLISGSGPFFHKLQGRIKKRGLEKNVVFLGYVSRSRLVKVYQNATVHVVPSHYEGLPTVLLEAMSCGLPVVATDIGGNNEVISSGVNGFLVPVKSPRIMAKSVLRLLDDPDLRKKIGTAARKTIEKYYTWDKVTDNVLKFYESVLKTK
jgi:glycosyltransferase involved in cell wall biosynthesis